MGCQGEMYGVKPEDDKGGVVNPAILHIRVPEGD